MSEADTLRMVAEVQDKFSGPLGKLRDSLRVLGGAKPGAGPARDLDLLTKSAQNAHQVIKTGLSPAMAAMGLSAFTLGAAFSAVKSAISGFSSSTVELSHLGKEVGLTINQLRTLQSVGAKVNLSSDEINSSAVGLANAMEGLRRGRGSLADFFRGQKDFRVREEGQRLQKMARETKDAGVYLRESINFLQSIPDPVQKQVAASALGISGKFGRMSLKEYDEYTKRAADRLGKTTPQMLVDAKRYEYALQDLGDTADRLRLSIGAALLPTMATLGQEFEKFVSENRDGIKETFKEIATGLKAFDWKGFAGDIKDAVHGLAELFRLLGLVSEKSFGGDALGNTKREFGWLKENLIPHALDKFLPGGGSAPGGPKTPSGAGGDWLNGGAFSGGGGAGGAGGATPQKQSFSPTLEGGVPTSEGGVTSESIRAALRGGVDAARDRFAGSAAGAEAGNFLAQRRARFGEELKNNPELKLRFAAIASLEHESDPLAVAESAINRGDYTGRTLSSILKGGPHSFYGPARSGLVEPRMQSLKMNHAKLAKMMRGIDSALAGSNVLDGATDQGSPTDPNGSWMGGRKKRDGEIYNDWGGGPGGHEGARRYRERLMEGARVDQRRARETESLARRSRENGLVGGGAQKIEGDASLRIDFQNMPRGTRVSHEASGMFKNVHVNRGRAMGLASEEG